MIEELHNLTNIILGIDKSREFSNLYKLSIINTNDYVIKLKDSQDNIVRPKRIKKNNTIDYELSSGVYKLEVYIKDGDNLIKDYFEEIYVSSNMYGSFKTMKL